MTDDFYQPAQKHGYNFVQAEVTAIDRKAKTISTTTAGTIAYDILVLSPGIAYDYEKQFPAWSAEKITTVAQACPAALMPGSEHLALKRQLENMDDGDVIIVPLVSDKFRCPPAPYERTAMVANYLKNEGIARKVVVLDTRGGKFAKGKAFKESWKDNFADIIEYKGFIKILDVDTVKKEITYLEFSADKSGVLKGKGHVLKPKDGNGKFRYKGTGKALHEWFNGSMRELFS